MTAEEWFYGLMAGDAGLTALVGERIYPALIPQDAELPAIAYQRVSGQTLHSHSPAVESLEFGRIQVTVLAPTYAQAKAVAAAVRGALDGHRDKQGFIWLDNERDDLAPSELVAVVRQDYLFYYSL